LNTFDINRNGYRNVNKTKKLRWKSNVKWNLDKEDKGKIKEDIIEDNKQSKNSEKNLLSHLSLISNGCRYVL